MNKKNQSKDRTQEIYIQELEYKVDKYKQEYGKVLEIKQQYKESIKEIFELLHNKEAPLQTGGYNTPSIKESDEVLFVQLRQTIYTMEDDQQILEGIHDYLEARKEFINNFPFTWPIETNGVPRITSGFGFREDLFNDGKVHFHAGIDIPGKEGDKILAPAEGDVKATIYNDESMGNVIVLKHQYGFTTGYSHLKAISVKKGDKVQRGDVIGLMGDEGLHSQGSHLHYEIRKDGTPIDPMLLLSTNY